MGGRGGVVSLLHKEKKGAYSKSELCFLPHCCLAWILVQSFTSFLGTEKKKFSNVLNRLRIFSTNSYPIKVLFF